MKQPMWKSSPRLRHRSIEALRSTVAEQLQLLDLFEGTRFAC